MASRTRRGLEFCARQQACVGSAGGTTIGSADGYAIGDVHGCFRSFRLLLAAVEFNPGRERVLITGDLVNRGPRSLETLRAIRTLGASAQVVLGNHDLHALALRLGVGVPKPRDDFGGLFAAKDRDVLLDWLRGRPLLHRENGWVMVHAGLHPSWSLREAEELAAELETVLRGPLAATLLRGLYVSSFPAWHERMDRVTRLRLALSAFTRLRCVDARGEPDFGFKGPPRAAPPGLVPWYVQWRDNEPNVVLFGHWAAHGFGIARGAICLDGGCYAGGTLWALRLRDGAAFHQPNAEVPTKRRAASC